MFEGFKDYTDLPDLQEDRSKALDLTYIIMKQLDTIRVIASREFHQGILLRSDSGVVRNYLPDVLESYKKAIFNLVDLLETYAEKEEGKTNLIDIKQKDGEEEYDYCRRLLRMCLQRLKEMGVLPDEKRISEIIKLKKGKK